MYCSMLSMFASLIVSFYNFCSLSPHFLHLWKPGEMTYLPSTFWEPKLYALDGWLPFIWGGGQQPTSPAPKFFSTRWPLLYPQF